MDAQFRVKINDNEYGTWIADETIQTETGFSLKENASIIYTFEDIRQLNQFINRLEELKEEVILRKIARMNSCINTIKMN